MTTPSTTEVVQIASFGGPEVLSLEDAPVPTCGPGEVLVRVEASGVGPWDALIRDGNSVLDQPLPLILGSEVSGYVEAVGDGHGDFVVGQAVFGATNGRFVGGYARYSLCEARRLAIKPAEVTHIEAAALPVAAVTAYQMLFDAARLKTGQSVLVHGAAGVVGRYALQLARRAGLRVSATARPQDRATLERLGIEATVDLDHPGRASVDAILDLVGGERQSELFNLIGPGGRLISIVAAPDQAIAAKHGVRAEFMLVDVRSEVLLALAEAVASGDINVDVGITLPLREAVRAHRILGGELPRPDGKIVLTLP